MTIPLGPTAETAGLKPDIVETLRKYMYYLDVTQDDGGIAEHMVSQAKKDPPLILYYARELQAMIKEYGIDALMSLARSNVKALEQGLDKIGTTPTLYGKSISWTLWHVAKSRFLASEKGKAIQAKLPNADKYHPYDPLAHLKNGATSTDITRAQEARNEIFQSMFGWEVYNIFSPYTQRGNRSGLVNAFGGVIPDNITSLLDLRPKPDNNTLSTYQLRDLGQGVLKALK